jgi:hypothetical protein
MLTVLAAPRRTSSTRLFGRASRRSRLAAATAASATKKLARSSKRRSPLVLSRLAALGMHIRPAALLSFVCGRARAGRPTLTRYIRPSLGPCTPLRPFSLPSALMPTSFTQSSHSGPPAPGRPRAFTCTTTIKDEPLARHRTSEPLLSTPVWSIGHNMPPMRGRETAVGFRRCSRAREHSRAPRR